ncbi:MAG: hypothetical protein JST89_15340 [Cyanobacteria bacterium SZAS-4]|nr:hypothetical protein [Cyanobacteria bacterium SZAS-4]
MSNKLLAGLLVGATLLATGLSAPAEAKNNDYQNLLNAQAMQAYQQNLANQQYNQYGYGYGYGLGSGIGAPGIDPNDPQAFQKAQYRQWLSTQGGNRGYTNQGFMNSHFYQPRPNYNRGRGWGNNNGLWNGRIYTQRHH